MSQGNLLDRTIGYFSPSWAQKRLANRQVMEIMASYRGAIQTRLDNAWSASENVLGFSHLREETLIKMRDRARQLERNNPIAKSLLNRATDNIVSTGFKFQAMSADDKWNSQAEDYLRDEYENIDVGGLTWLEVQHLTMRHHFLDGDIGSILRNDGRLQFIKGEYIQTPRERITDIRFKDGVEVNVAGRPIRYWITSYDAKRKVSYVPIDASNFILFPRLGAFNQVRGEPVLAQSFGLFEQLNSWTEAVIVAARIAACFGLIIEQGNASKALSSLPKGVNGQGNSQAQLGLEPGMIKYVNPGDKVSQLTPQQPQQNFPDVLSSFMRLAGLPMGLPLELVFLDFSQTNFSSARASMNQAYRAFRITQHLFIERFLKRTYRWKISKAIKDGILSPREDAWKHRWVAPSWPFLDPVKESQAAQMNIDIGLDTLGSMLIERGMDFNQWLDIRAKEVAAMRARNIPVLHSSLLVQDGMPGPTIISGTIDEGAYADESTN